MQLWVRKAPVVAWRNCPGSRADSDPQCAGYHGVRPFLYCTGLRTSFVTSWRLFAEPVQGWPGTVRAPRVLISGAADFVIPAIVTQALRTAGGEPDVTIVDKCRTPLLMCEDAASRLAMRWQTVHVDIKGHRPSASYDLIVSDRFLSFFAPGQRLEIIRAWRRLLRTRGRVITTLSIYPDAESARKDRRALRLEALRRFEDQHGMLPRGTTRERLSYMLNTYNSFRHEHVISDPEQTIATFEECGFEVKEARRMERNTGARSAGAKRLITRMVADKPD